MPNIVIDKAELLLGIKTDRIALANSQEAPSGQYARSNGVDLHREGYIGHAFTAQTFNQAGPSNAAINSLPRAVAIDVASATPNVYQILGGLAGTAPRVIKIVSDAYSSTVTTIPDAGHSGHNFTTLPTTGFWGEDIITYKVGATYYVFYSWNDNTDGDVGRAAIDGTSPNDDFMSTTPTGNAVLTAGIPHRMTEGADGKLYITNGRYVSQFDGATGTNGTFSATKYDLGVGWVATDVRRYGDLLAISAIQSGTTYRTYTFASTSRVTLWNMTETGLGLVYDVDDYFLSAIFPVGQKLFAFTFGKNNTLKVHRFTGSKFEPFWESAIPTSAPDPRSIELYKDLVYFVPTAGSSSVWTLDPKLEAVHLEAIVNDGTNDATTSGFLRNIDQGKLHLGGLFGGTYKGVYLTASSTGFATGGKFLRTRVYPLSFKATIKKFTFFLSNLGSSAQVQFSLFKNYTNESVGTAGTDLLNLTLDNTTYGNITEYEIERTIPQASSFYMTITLTGNVGVRAIVIDWEPSN